LPVDHEARIEMILHQLRYAVDGLVARVFVRWSVSYDASSAADMSALLTAAAAAAVEARLPM
jgi:hypothetical protein